MVQFLDAKGPSLPSASWRAGPAILVAAMTFCSGAQALAAPAGNLLVGAAKVEMTGPLGPSQTGRYDHEHVYARAIVVDNGTIRIALVNYDGPDSGFDMEATRGTLATLLKVPVVNVLVTHTHTHSSSIMPPGPPVVRLADKGKTSAPIIEAVRRAMARQRAARMRFGNGDLFLNVNRDGISPETHRWAQGANLDAPSDKSVAVLSFETPEGRPLAAYVTYAMHPINAFVLGVVTGDVPEAMERYVEQAFGDDTIVEFAQGPSGDQNPRYLRPSTNVMALRNGIAPTGFLMDRESQEAPLRQAGSSKPPADPGALDRLFRFIDGEGAVFGEEVIRVLSQPLPVIESTRIDAGQANLSCPGRLRLNADPNNPALREGVDATYQDGPPVEYHVGMIGLGDVAIISLNGEFYTLIGQRIKNSAPMKNTMIATLANERVMGYVPDDASYGHQTFQVLGARAKPGCAETGIATAVNHLEAAYLSGTLKSAR